MSLKLIKSLQKAHGSQTWRALKAVSILDPIS